MDEDIIHLYIDGELIETTAEHPFYTDEGEWVNAAELEVGDEILSLDGDYGTVENVVVVEDVFQPMYNLTVDEAHTFFIGGGDWLVHNTSCLVGEFNVRGRTVNLRAYNYEAGSNPMIEQAAANQAYQLRQEANQIRENMLDAKEKPWELGRVTLASPPNSSVRTVNQDAPQSAAPYLEDLPGVQFATDLDNLGQPSSATTHAERQLAASGYEYIVISNSRGMCDACEASIVNIPVFYLDPIR